MVDEAEQFKEEDKKFKERIEAKNSLESMLYQVKSQPNLPEETKKVVEEEIQWLDEHPQEDKQVYDEHRDKLITLLTPPQQEPEQKEEEKENNVKIEEVD